MDKFEPPIADQAKYWDQWNASGRESSVTTTSEKQWQAIAAILRAEKRRPLSIIDVGCGAGWTCERLAEFGSVTGTDMAEGVIERARARLPHVNFVCGDFFALDLPTAGFDVVVCLEVLAHVADHPAFIQRLAQLLKPGGLLILCTQNRPILERWDAVAQPDPAQIRRWVDAKELRHLLSREFSGIEIRSLFPVGNRGYLRPINSPKLNALLHKVVSEERLTQLKEHFMLGHTLLATANKR